MTQWAEEEGTHDHPRGPGPAAAARDRARRAGCAASWRCSPSSPSGSAPRRDGHRSPRRCSTSCARASAGGRADYSGISHDAARRRRGAVLAVPARPGPAPHPGTPRLFLERLSARRTAAPGFVAVGHRRPADDLRADAPVYLVTGRVLAALPVRGADPAGRRQLPGGLAGAVRASCTRPRRPARRRRRRAVRVTSPRGTTAAPRRSLPDRSARTRCSCRSTGPGARRTG